MDRNLIEILGKVIIAAAWADKVMSREEINSLKDLLFQYQHTITMSDVEPGDGLWMLMSGFYTEKNADTGIGIPAREMAKFEMYTESPIDAAEREQLANQLCEAIQTEEDKNLVISTLQNMIEADGKITEEEQVILNEIKTRIEKIDTGIFGYLGRLLQNAIWRRAQKISDAPNREKYFDEFLRNKVYYEMRRRLDLDETNLDIPDEYRRKLGTVGGMMARVAQVDSIVWEKEMDKMISIVETGWGIMSILKTGWGLSHEASLFVMDVAMSEVSKNFDYLRMSRDFFDSTTNVERANLLDLLFAVANADGRVSHEEFKEIRIIADYLLLSSNQVEEAYARLAQ
jgi:uncharacterized tellurite resistance protein B-like protein